MLETPSTSQPDDTGYFFVVASRADGGESRESRSIADLKGTYGRMVYTFTTGNSPDFTVRFLAHHKGAISIDNLNLMEGDGSGWRRDFTNGVSLLNTSSTRSVTFHLDRPLLPAGAATPVTSVTLEPQHGLVLQALGQVQASVGPSTSKPVLAATPAPAPVRESAGPPQAKSPAATAATVDKGAVAVQRGDDFDTEAMLQLPPTGIQAGAFETNAFHSWLVVVAPSAAPVALAAPRSSPEVCAGVVPPVAADARRRFTAVRQACAPRRLRRRAPSPNVAA